MIAASRDQEPAVGAECQAADDASVTAESADQGAAMTVPDSHGAVLAGRGDPSAFVVGAERQGVHVALVSPEDQEFLTGLHVPGLDRVALACCRQPPAIRAERHAQTRPGDPRVKAEAGFL